MTCSVHDPLLGDRLAVTIASHGSRVGVTVRDSALFHRDVVLVWLDALSQGLLTVSRMNRRVAIAIEDNDRNRLVAALWPREECRKATARVRRSEGL